MYKSSRDTGQWFKTDFKPMIADRNLSADMGPGKYESPARGADTQQRQISWNLGKVPFKTNVSRFKQDYRGYFQPGPGSYDPS